MKINRAELSDATNLSDAEGIMSVFRKLEQYIDNGIIDKYNFKDQLNSITNVLDLPGKVSAYSGKYIMQEDHPAIIALKDKLEELGSMFYNKRYVVKSFPVSLSGTGSLYTYIECKNIVTFELLGEFEEHKVDDPASIVATQIGDSIKVYLKTGILGSNDVLNYNGILSVLTEDYSQ